MRILYAEDEPQLREAMAEELTDLGAEVITCSDGVAALQALKENTFDVVITDLKMPYLDGIALRKKVSTDSYPCPQVWIAFSAYSEQQPEEFKAMGFDEVFYKPFKPKLLIGMCMKILSQKRKSAA
jgi:two-component system capsular synthesis sensor histidine kinase RcsC